MVQAASLSVRFPAAEFGAAHGNFTDRPSPYSSSSSGRSRPRRRRRGWRINFRSASTKPYLSWCDGRRNIIEMKHAGDLVGRDPGSAGLSLDGDEQCRACHGRYSLSVGGLAILPFMMPNQCHQTIAASSRRRKLSIGRYGRRRLVGRCRAPTRDRVWRIARRAGRGTSADQAGRGGDVSSVANQRSISPHLSRRSSVGLDLRTGGVALHLLKPRSAALQHLYAFRAGVEHAPPKIGVRTGMPWPGPGPSPARKKNCWR